MMMKLCTGSVYDDNGWYLVSISWYCLILGGTGSVKGLYACIYWKKWRFGRVLPMPHRHTDNRKGKVEVMMVLEVATALCWWVVVIITSKTRKDDCDVSTNGSQYGSTHYKTATFTI